MAVMGRRVEWRGSEGSVKEGEWSGGEVRGVCVCVCVCVCFKFGMTSGW